MTLADERPPGGAAVEQANSRRAADRLASRVRELAGIEAREPLRRRILEELAEGPATPSALAHRLAVAKESVSRQLRALRDGGLVDQRKVPGDGRRHEQLLTAAGIEQLGGHRAFGAVEPPPPSPTREQELQFLRAALEHAVGMRRQANLLDDAADRLRIVLQQAERRGADELAVEAIAELATTLRQNRQVDEVDALLQKLESVALGQGEIGGAALALPAAAHREYALGRLAEERGDNLSRRAEHLISAAMLYGQLADAPNGDSPSTWRERQAWSVVSLAGNLCERSRPELALEQAGRALGTFEDLEDSYGQSRSLFMLGFSLRLLGDFDHAWDCLNEAHRLAAESAFERYQADSLMQMGEVRRCQGDAEIASELLIESLERARRMELTVTHAFAESALGAVRYQEHRLGEAVACLGRAHQLFAGCDHREGLALNARRQAIVARCASSSGPSDELRTAEELTAFALKLYKELRSPAGIAACEVEQGRQLVLRGKRAAATVEALIARLDDGEQRNLLELDPWVPKVLAAFASEVEDEDLSRRAREVLAVAGQRLAGRARCVVRCPAQALSRVRDQVLTGRSAAPSVQEMGGEARRQWDGVALVRA